MIQSSQIQARIQAYFSRVSKPETTPALYIRTAPSGGLRYLLLSGDQKQEETLANILNINALEAGALALTGSSKAEAEQTVADWLLRGLSDEAAQSNEPMQDLGLFISMDATKNQKYWVYCRGTAVKEIELNQLVNKYQAHG